MHDVYNIRCHNIHRCKSSQPTVFMSVNVSVCPEWLRVWSCVPLAFSVSAK